MNNLNKKSIDQLKSAKFNNLSKIFGGENWTANSLNDAGCISDTCYMTGPKGSDSSDKDVRADGTESCKDLDKVICKEKAV